MNLNLEPPASGVHNMDADRGLLALAEEGKPGARLYTWDGPWLSLGMFQRADRDLLPGCPIPYVMRPTGGRAVLHGHDLTIGLAAPLASLELGDAACHRSVRAVYRAVVRPIVSALSQAGVPAALGEDTPFVGRTPRSADCFAHVSANDVVHRVTGQKVCGVALRLTDRAVLVQASLPIRRPEIDPALALSDPAPVGWSALDPVVFAQALQDALGWLAVSRGR